MSGIKRAKIPRSPFVLEEAEEEETEEEEEEEDDEEEEQEEEEEEGAEEDDSDEDEMEEPHTCEPGQGTPSGPPRTAACNKKLLLDSSAAVARDKPRTSKDNTPTNGNRRTLKEPSTKDLLQSLIEELRSTNRRVEHLEQMLSGGQPSPRARLKKLAVPNAVRQETRRVYRVLLEEQEDFEGWRVGEGITFKDRWNQATLGCLVKEVKALNPTFMTSNIKDAAYRFYRTKCEAESAQKKGLTSSNLTRKRRRERKGRKLTERKSRFEKSSAAQTKKQKDKWARILSPSFMSSDESDGDSIVTKPLTWRSQLVDKFFERLDQASQEGKSPQARRQTKPRVMGEPSSRPRPVDDSLPSWAFVIDS